MPTSTGSFTSAVPHGEAAPIVTDTAGLEVGDVFVPVSDGMRPAYFARPAGDGPYPVMLVVHEIFGVHEHIRDVCRRLAKRGYLAVAPDLYAGVGDVGAMTDIQEIIRRVVSRVTDAQVMSDLDDTIDWARRTGKADVARQGIIGFCWGGRIVWLYAAHSPDLKAGVAWYGRLAGEATAAQPRHPIDIARKVRCPVLGLYGAADQGIPAATVEQMRAALDKASKTFQIILYPDTPHAFFADYRPSFRQGPAEDGWRRCLDWLETYGVA
jgi:carboxymethylenebutenolidase